LSNSVERIAILPAEVLITNSSAEWMRLAVPLVLQEDLAISAKVVSFFAKDGSAAYEGVATKVLRTTVEDRNGKLRLEAVVTDPQTQRNEQVISIEGNSAAGILLPADQLAKRIDPHAENFPARNLEALKAFTSAAGTGDLSQRLQLLTEAVRADGNFGLAYIALVETAAQAAPQNLRSLVAEGTAHRSQFAPLERARWDAMMARYFHRPLAQQAEIVGAVLKVAPNNVEALATLGADRFLQGNGGEGERLLRQAIALSPANINLPLQLANGLIESRRFSDAITVLRPLSGNAPAIPALAVATLLNGKAKEASAVFQNLISLLPAGTSAASFLRTQWEAISAPATQPVPLPAASSISSGYNAFLNGHFEEAVRFWQDAVQQTGDTDLRARAMLAASLNGAGRTADAREILVLPFVPDLNDGGVALAFHQMRQLLRL
jgi:Flp pilus assembly protein TadD